MLLNSPLVADLIARGEVGEIKAVMSKSRELGMQTFDQALYDMYQRGDISYADAIHHADSPNDLRLMIKLRNNETKGAGFLSGVTLEGFENKDDK